MKPFFQPRNLYLFFPLTAICYHPLGTIALALNTHFSIRSGVHGGEGDEGSEGGEKDGLGPHDDDGLFSDISGEDSNSYTLEPAYKLTGYKVKSPIK